MLNKIAIIGLGKLGQTLAKAFRNTNFRVIGVFDKERKKCQSLAYDLQLPYFSTLDNLLFDADIIFLTVPDQAIASMANKIANSNIPLGVSKYFFHCSGSQPLSLLKPLSNCNIGGFHPLQAFTEKTNTLENIYIAIDGNTETLAVAQALADTLLANPIHVPAKDKALYHAAACILSNYLVSLNCLAEDIFAKWSIPREAALNLLKSSVNNILVAENTASALTGPISRGDSDTIAKHLQVLPNKYLNLYCQLGLYTLDIAKANCTISTTQYAAIADLLKNKEITNV